MSDTDPFEADGKFSGTSDWAGLTGSSQPSPPVTGKDKWGNDDLVGFKTPDKTVSDAFVKDEKVSQNVFAPGAGNTDSSRLILIDEKIICKPGENRCEETMFDKICGWKIGFKDLTN